MIQALLCIFTLCLALCQAAVYTSPSFFWGQGLEGQQYKTESFSAHDVVDIISYISGAKESVTSSLAECVTKTNERKTPSLVVIYLQDDLTTDQVVSMNKNEKSFEFIKKITSSQSSLTLPYVSTSGSSFFVKTIASSFPEYNVILASERDSVGGVSPAMSINEISSSLPRILTSKIVILIVDLKGKGKDTYNGLISEIDSNITKATKGNSLSVLSFSSPIAASTNHQFAQSQRFLAQTVGGANLPDITYSGLYITADILTFLIIFGVLIVFYYTGLSNLMSIESCQGMEVQPPPVGKEM